MRNQTFALRIFILCLMAVLGISLNAAVPVGPVSNAKKPLIYSKNLTCADIEAYTGHKMSFMERVSFHLNKRKYVEKFVGNSNEDKGTDGWAIAGFVCGILVPPLGIIFSAIALGHIKKNGTKGKGLATAGLIIGIVLTGLILVGIVVGSTMYIYM